ncbi:MAG: glycosyltransferase [Dehalococcoidales bacterium]|nr:glycosyltransferase [Dehalococcoidales bacterium]
MKILFLVPQLPYPLRKGAAIRTYYFLRWLAHAHSVSMLAFAEDGAVPSELLDLCAEVRVVPPPARSLSDRLRDVFASPLPDLALRLYSEAYERELLRWLAEESFDVVQAESLEMALPWLRAREKAGGGKRPLGVFDDLNAEYLLQWRAFRTDAGNPRRWAGAAYSAIQTAKLRTFERRLCRDFERVVVVSAEDAAALRALRGDFEASVVPNGVDCDYFAFRPPESAAEASPQVVFTGTMDFRPNVDAVVWFTRSVFPLVRHELSDARFVVVGNSPAPAVRQLASLPGVEVTGPVPDVRPYLTASAVYAVPMRIGGGVRLKVLEAMAAGIPVVSTSLGCAGTTAEAGRHFLRADREDDFARAVVGVLRREGALAEMVREARELVEARYHWGHLCPLLAAVYAAGSDE